MGIEFHLAVVTAVRTIGEVRPVRHFVRFYHLMADTDQSSKFYSLLQLSCCQARTHCGHSHRTLAEGNVGSLGNHCAIDTTTESNGTTFNLPETVKQSITLIFNSGHEIAVTGRCWFRGLSR